MTLEPAIAVRLDRLAAVDKEIAHHAGRLFNCADLLREVFEESSKAKTERTLGRVDEDKVLRLMIELCEERIKMISDLEDRRDAINDPKRLKEEGKGTPRLVD